LQLFPLIVFSSLDIQIEKVGSPRERPKEDPRDPDKGFEIADAGATKRAVQVRVMDDGTGQVGYPET
jgi:hypothetical protein